MSIERARAHLRALGLEEKIREFPVSSATVELAAKAVGCEPARQDTVLRRPPGGLHSGSGRRGRPNR